MQGPLFPRQSLLTVSTAKHRLKFSTKKNDFSKYKYLLCRGPGIRKTFPFGTKAPVVRAGGGVMPLSRSKQDSGLQVAGAYSKTWSYREDALLTLYQQLMETPVGTPKEDLKSVLRASVFLIRRSIRDIVTPVSPLHPQCPVPAVRGRDTPGGGVAGAVPDHRNHQLPQQSPQQLGF